MVAFARDVAVSKLIRLNSALSEAPAKRLDFSLVFLLKNKKF